MCVQTAQHVFKYIFVEKKALENVDLTYRLIQLFHICFTNWKKKDAKRVGESLKEFAISTKRSQLLLQKILPQSEWNTVAPAIADMIQDVLHKTQRISGDSAKIQLEQELEEIARADARMHIPEKTPSPRVHSFSCPGAPRRKGARNLINIDEFVMREASQKYWLDFQEELKNGNHIRLKKLLREIRERLEVLQSNSADRLLKLQNELDTDFIDTLIDRKCFDGQMFINLFSTIWEQIKSVHAPISDQEWTDWRNETITALQNGAEWHVILPKILNQVLIKLDQIEDQKRAFQNMF